MTGIQRALVSGDPGDMAEALLIRQREDGKAHDRTAAISHTVMMLEFDWDGRPTGITSSDVDLALRARGL